MRDCAGCTQCCETMGITELDKGPYIKCKHICQAGCDIYGSHPLSCSVYQCLWRTEYLPQDYRPDKCGFLMAIREDEGKWIIHLDECHRLTDQQVLLALNLAIDLIDKSESPKLRGIKIFRFGTRGQVDQQNRSIFISKPYHKSVISVCVSPAEKEAFEAKKPPHRLRQWISMIDLLC